MLNIQRSDMVRIPAGRSSWARTQYYPEAAPAGTGDNDTWQAAKPGTS
jgi:hypothetical protein